MKPEFAATEYHRQGRVVFEVYTKKATFQGVTWGTLNTDGKKKFENLLFLANADKNPVVIYT